MIRRPPRSTHCISSAASDVYKRQAVWLSFFPPFNSCTLQYIYLYALQVNTLIPYIDGDICNCEPLQAMGGGRVFPIFACLIFVCSFEDGVGLFLVFFWGGGGVGLFLVLFGVGGGRVFLL